MMGQTNRCFLCQKPIEQVYHVPPSEERIGSYRCARCGKVVFTFEAFTEIGQPKFDSSRHLISGYTRELTESRRSPIVIKPNNIQKILDSVDIPRNVLDKLNKVLLYLERKSKFFGDSVRINILKDYPIVYAMIPHELHFFLETLGKSGDIKLEPQDPDEIIVTLTMPGWIRIAEIHKIMPESDQCFVAMWFDTSLDDVYKNAIAKAIETTGYKAVRLDLVEHNEKICDRIIAEIRKSSFLVADFTGHRGGVYFEAGFAMGLGLPVIWLCKETDIENTHFDTRQYNHVVWTSVEDLYQKLLNRIEATILKR